MRPQRSRCAPARRRRDEHAHRRAYAAIIAATAAASAPTVPTDPFYAKQGGTAGVAFPGTFAVRGGASCLWST